MYTEITCCRVCKSELKEVIHLGEMAMSGIFPKPGVEVESGPLTVVRCVGSCGLVQLKQTYDLPTMYGDNYGYRSGLNPAMVMHLASTAQAVSKVAGLKAGSTVVDIGSNDGTLLAQYLVKGMRKIGIDPTAKKFRQYYDDDVEILADFFNRESVKERFRGLKADVVTSISCFYDLENPLEFMADVRDVLKPEGIWYFEQSYLPLMLSQTAYDTICHEHLEYYSLTTICWMAEKCGLRIIDAQPNKVNGGSIAITAVRDINNKVEANPNVKALLNYEKALMLDTDEPYKIFRHRVDLNKAKLFWTLDDIVKSQGKIVMGYGASTKGNTLLQYMDMSPSYISAIVEINPDKYGCVTPGTNILIVPEGTGSPDYYLVLPWHFRDGIIRATKRFRQNGGKLIFPLPEVEIVGDEQ